MNDLMPTPSAADDGDTIPAVLRNRTATMPNTSSARKNHAALIRALQDFGYTGIGRAIERDKSFVCRLLQGEAPANLFDLLTVFDVAGLRIVHADDLEAGNDAELVGSINIALEKLSTLEKLPAADDEIVAAMIPLARRALQNMSEQS